MSTAFPDQVINITAPVTDIDEYTVTAGGIFSISSNQTNSSGLLANDAQSEAHWQLGFFGGTGMTITSIRLADPDARDVLVPATISSSLGTWNVSSNGSLTYVADGLESKKLGAGELWRDGLFYTVKNINNGLISTGIVTMDIIGVTDSPEISVGLLPVIELTEDTWHQLERDESGYVTFALAAIELVFQDNGASLSAGASISLSFSDPSLYLKYSDQLQDISNNLSVVFSALWSGKYIFSDLKISQQNFDFLEAGEALEIAVVATISDDNPFSQASSSTIGVLTIEGINHPPVATPDSATVTRGVVLTRESSVSVLANDDDTDPVDKDTLHVTGIYTDGGEFFELQNGEATLSTTYGSLTIYADGTYRYDPSLPYRLTDNYDAFRYVVADGSGGFAVSELTIHVLPNPKAVNLVALETEIFMLDDDLSVIGGAQAENTGLFTSTPLGDFYIRSLSESPPDVNIFDLGFSMFSQTNSSELPTAASLASATFPSMVWETMSVDDRDIRTWTYSLEFNAFSDFRLLNPGDQVWLNYVIRGTGDALYDRDQLFDVAIVGDNDAPEAAANYNLVYAGHSAWGVEGSASGLLTNDTDPDYHDVLHVSSIRSGDIEISFAEQTPDPFQPLVLEGTYGWLYVYSGGSYQYTASKPEADAIEPMSDTVGPTYETFTYTVVDKWGASDEEQLIIQVLGPNDKPTALDDTFVVYLDSQDPEEAIDNLFRNDLDSNPGRLSLAGTTSFPSDFLRLDEYGDIFLRASALEYLPAGEALNLYFDYTTSNGVAEGESESASVHVQIIGKNEAPVATDDVYFYENIAGSVFTVGEDHGLVSRLHIIHEQTDTDIDQDNLIVSQVWFDEVSGWVGEDGAQVQLTDDIVLTVFWNGSFILDTPDAYRGAVSFWYSVFDGMTTDQGFVTIEVGGPALLAEHLLINEISLMNGEVVRSVYTDNGAAPNRILVGAASIELLNTSGEAISAASLATLKLEIVGPDGSMTTISLGELTGLTRGANGEALNQLSIPAGGILMFYEPGTLGLGTWAIYGPNKSFIAGASGSYAGDAWPLGSTAEEAMAVNLVQDGTSIDFFAANGADTEGLTGIIGLGDSAQGEQGMAGVPWAGNHLGLLAEEQYDGTMSSDADTVFGRRSFTDTDSEADWSHYVVQARTVGDTNTRLSGGAVRFVANPDDPTENLNPNQGLSTSEGQNKQTGSGSLTGGGGHDVLMGQAGADSLFGDELDDWLHGGAGDDSLDGGSGGDWLQGGAGVDQLSGGSGADVFVFAAVTDSGHSSLGNHDWIVDFTVSEDRIDLSMIDAHAGQEGDQAFAWGGLVSGRSQAATMVGLLVYWVENGMTRVQADVVGDNLAPLELIIHGAQSLSAADFVM